VLPFAVKVKKIKSSLSMPCRHIDGTRWRCVVHFPPQQLYLPGKDTQYPLNRRLGGLSEHFRDEINLLALLGIEAQLIQPVAQSLYQECNPSSSTLTVAARN